MCFARPDPRCVRSAREIQTESEKDYLLVAWLNSIGGRQNLRSAEAKYIRHLSLRKSEIRIPKASVSHDVG